MAIFNSYVKLPEGTITSLNIDPDIVIFLGHECSKPLLGKVHVNFWKWILAPVIDRISRVNPLLTGVWTHLRFVGWATKYNTNLWQIAADFNLLTKRRNDQLGMTIARETEKTCNQQCYPHDKYLLVYYWSLVTLGEWKKLPSLMAKGQHQEQNNCT